MTYGYTRVSTKGQLDGNSIEEQTTAMSSNYLQMGEPFSHIYDIDRRLKATYMTFGKCDGVWRFYGHCFYYEIINLD